MVKIKSIFLLFLTCCLILGNVRNGFAVEIPFVHIENGIFKAGNEEYKALGVCIYPAHSANYDYITRVIHEAKSNGITLIRAVDLWEGVYGQDDSALYSDEVWQRVDWMIKNCKDNGMRLLLDLSSVRQFLYYSSNQRDSYSSSAFPTWNKILEFVTSRVNSFTGVRYKDDPVIMSYALAGEPVCYGGQLDDWSNGYFTSRSPEDIQASIYYIADTLRSLDSNHLISAGGLLHLTPTDNQGVPFYKNIWEYPNIDYAAIHIYPETTESIGEWENLPLYKQFCDTLGKPLIVEEFGEGGSDIIVKKEYLNICYNRCYENNIPVTILWNWSLGQSFDLYSHMKEITDILQYNARRWGYSNNFDNLANPFIDEKNIFESFEENNTKFTPNVTDPGYGGDITISDKLSSNGKYSLKIPVDFSDKHQWYWLHTNFSSPIALNGNYLAADIFLPEEAPPLTMKFSLNGIEQQESGRINNYLIPGQWNTVYVNLTKENTSPDGCDWVGNTVPDIQNVNTLGLLFINGNSIYSGEIYVDNLRTGNLTLINKENNHLEINSIIQQNNNHLNITVSSTDSNDNLLFSYYIMKNGKLFYANKQTNITQINCNLPSGKYLLYIYAEHPSNGTAKNVKYFVIK